jgi:hypothetical protein
MATTLLLLARTANRVAKATKNEKGWSRLDFGWALGCWLDER